MAAKLKEKPKAIGPKHSYTKQETHTVTFTKVDIENLLILEARRVSSIHEDLIISNIEVKYNKSGGVIINLVNPKWEGETVPSTGTIKTSNIDV